MKLLDNFLLVILARNLKPFIKSLCWTEDLRQKKVQKSPQFMEIILHIRIKHEVQGTEKKSTKRLVQETLFHTIISNLARSHQYPNILRKNKHLKRGSRDKKPIVGAKKSHRFRKEWIFILDSMRFIDDNITPAKATQCCLLFDGHLKACDAYIKFPSN